MCTLRGHYTSRWRCIFRSSWYFQQLILQEPTVWTLCSTALSTKSTVVVVHSMTWSSSDVHTGRKGFTLSLTRSHLHQRFALFHSSTFSGSPEKALLKATISAEVRQCRGIGGKRIFVHDLPRLTGEIHIFWLNTHQHTTRTCTCHRVYTSYPCGNTG